MAAWCGGPIAIRRWRPNELIPVQRAFLEVCRRLGFPEHLTPHALRHTCATNLLYAGRPLPEVAQYLGHANQGVTATRASRPPSTPT